MVRLVLPQGTLALGAAKLPGIGHTNLAESAGKVEACEKNAVQGASRVTCLNAADPVMHVAFADWLSRVATLAGLIGCGK